MSKTLKTLSLMVLASLIFTGNALAGGAPHKIVIQVSTDDQRKQKIAMNNAVNLQKFYGIDNVDVEIAAYGPGLGRLTKKSKSADCVESLAMSDITFSACGNTMAKVAKKSGKIPVLLEEVQQVPAGVACIMEFQEQGYAYVRPWGGWQNGTPGSGPFLGIEGNSRENKIGLDELRWLAPV
jgi:intracellular sulfur oxidation DsrE/DsrF family protein